MALVPQLNLEMTVPSLSNVRLPKVLHLSHTDVRVDGRILKEVSALSAGGLGHQVAVGIDRPDGAVPGPPVPGVLLLALPSLARRLKRFRLCPDWIRYVAGFIDMSVRMTVIGLRYRPAVVHCHDAGFLHVGVFLRLAVGSKVVYDAHELESRKAGQSKFLSRCTLSLERWCWRHIALLVSVSPSILEWYSTHLGPKRSVLVLNSPVVPRDQAGLARGSRRGFGQAGYFHVRFNIPPSSPVFIYVGVLMAGRGIEPVLEAFGRPGIRSHVVFLGWGDTVGVVSRAKKFPNIHHHPAVPHDEVVHLVREAHCGLCLGQESCLSYRYALPNKLFEYAFAGIPVLASRLPEISRVVREFGLGMCCDSDPDSIEACVRRIEREGIESPTADLTELSWETQARHLQEAYQQLLAVGRHAL